MNFVIQQSQYSFGTTAETILSRISGSPKTHQYIKFSGFGTIETEQSLPNYDGNTSGVYFVGLAYDTAGIDNSHGFEPMHVIIIKNPNGSLPDLLELDEAMKLIPGSLIPSIVCSAGTTIKQLKKFQTRFNGLAKTKTGFVTFRIDFSQVQWPDLNIPGTYEIEGKWKQITISNKLRKGMVENPPVFQLIVQ